MSTFSIVGLSMFAAIIAISLLIYVVSMIRMLIREVRNGNYFGALLCGLGLAWAVAGALVIFGIVYEGGIYI